MNLTLKKALQLAMPALALGLSSSVAYAANCNSAMIDKPVYNADTGIVNLPLVEVLDDPDGTLNFVALQLQQIPKQWTFRITEQTQLGDDCAFINTPTPTFDFNTGELHLIGLQMEDSNGIQFYEAKLKWNEQGEFVLTNSTGTQGRYSGVVLDAHHKPIRGATVSLNGIEAETTTDGEGHFTVMGIGNETCQILTVNASGFSPISKRVDIRFPDMKPCQG
ncbi:MAG: carboxypeptidase-like regulatory domain-containing protein [Candidatus Parabeggiatoa sp.]|nr:carboxypeptidase-like regulatory domain-containing protein [Candidatus Parabeggiatoa sp.]